MVAEVLNDAIQVKGRLFSESVVPRVFNFRRLSTEGTRVLLARGCSAGPVSVGSARSPGEADGKVIRIAGVMRSITEKSSGHCHHAVLYVGESWTFPLGFDARHAAGTVASALLLLTFAIHVGGALSQTLLTKQFRLLFVPGTHRRRRVPRVLVDASVVVDLGLGLISLVVVVVVIIVVPVVVVVVVIVDGGGLLPQLRLGREEEGAQEEQQNNSTRSHPRSLCVR